MSHRGAHLQVIFLAKSYAAFMIAAGVNAKAPLYIHRALVDHRHARRYGHRMPGNEREAANMLAAYLERELGGAKAAG